MAKMGQGMGMATLALVWLALLAALGAAHPVYWIWLRPMHLLVAAACLFVYPVGLALFSRAAPLGGRAMFIGIFFLSSFVAGNLEGWTGRFYRALPAPTFWLYQAGIGAAGAALAFALGLGRYVKRVQTREHEGNPPPGRWRRLAVCLCFRHGSAGRRSLRRRQVRPVAAPF